MDRKNKSLGNDLVQLAHSEFRRHASEEGFLPIEKTSWIFNNHNKFTFICSCNITEKVDCIQITPLLRIDHSELGAAKEVLDRKLGIDKVATGPRIRGSRSLITLGYCVGRSGGYAFDANAIASKISILSDCFNTDRLKYFSNMTSARDVVAYLDANEEWSKSPSVNLLKLYLFSKILTEKDFAERSESFTSPLEKQAIAIIKRNLYWRK